MALIWALRAGFAVAIVGLVALAGWTYRERRPEPSAVAVAPTPAATARPTTTPESVISRMARSTPTPTPRALVGKPSPPRVSVIDSSFEPPELQLRAGQTVTWKNDGAVSHDVSALGGEAWGSGALLTGGTFSRVFASPGGFDYFCSVHPTMRGRIVVEP